MADTRIVPVLMYHHVTPAGGMINVTPDHFRDQLRWLREHDYVSLSSAAFAEHLAGQPAPKRSVLITFDDGYLDNYVYAWPLLREFGFCAMVFVVTSWLGKGGPRQWAGHDGASLPETPTHAECTRYVEAGQAEKIALRWSEIDLMRQDGICEFHSHTHTHTRWDLRDGDKNTRMREELRTSRDCLLSHLGSVSDHLCWPQGYFDADYVRIAQESGFRHLYTTRAFGRNRPGSDPTSIFRFAVRNTSGESVGRRIRVAGHPFIAPVFNTWKRWKRHQRYAG